MPAPASSELVPEASVAVPPASDVAPAESEAAPEATLVAPVAAWPICWLMREAGVTFPRILRRELPVERLGRHLHDRCGERRIDEGRCGTRLDFQEAWSASAQARRSRSPSSRSRRDRQHGRVASARDAALGLLVVGTGSTHEVVRRGRRRVRAGGPCAMIPAANCRRSGTLVVDRDRLVVLTTAAVPGRVLGRRGEAPRQDAADQERQEHQVRRSRHREGVRRRYRRSAVRAMSPSGRRIGDRWTWG